MLLPHLGTVFGSVIVDLVTIAVRQTTRGLKEKNREEESDLTMNARAYVYILDKTSLYTVCRDAFFKHLGYKLILS